MNNYLFTIGVGVSDRPSRWQGICTIYGHLARGLTRMGHRCRFIVNPAAFDARALAGLDAAPGSHADVAAALAEDTWHNGFIWGGRIAPDAETAALFAAGNVPVIYSELGWFPQKGTVYFDRLGTNSQMSFDTPPPLVGLRRLRFAIARRRACRTIYGQRFGGPARPATARQQVFVPLQDETDTNITQDSPFPDMDSLLRFLSETYPDCHFTARPHPKAAPSDLSSYPNVTLQDPKANPYAELKTFDAVVGINSTMLSEAAFMGHDVVCFGNGIAKIYGIARHADPATPPARLQGPENRDQADAALAHLFLDRQLRQKRLSSPRYLQGTYLKQMLDL